jgi:PAS domain S-box-containing protein
MYATRKTVLLIRAGFGLALALLVALSVVGYLSVVRRSLIADQIVVGASLLALALVAAALLALRRASARHGLAEAELDRFFDLSLDFLVISTVEGYFKRVSPAVETVLGWTPEEFTSRPFLDFVHPDDVPRTMLEVERQMRSGEPVLHFENRYRHKNGGWRTLSSSNAPQSWRPPTIRCAGASGASGP